MKNLLNTNKEELYLLSQQDLKEIFWSYEYLADTISEILEKRKITEEPGSS